MSSAVWLPPPKNVALAADEVHVWRASLHVTETVFARLYATLTGAEQNRASRYRFPQDRQRFVVARGWLRAILGAYLGIEGAQLRFAYNPHGKPELDAAEDLTRISAGRRVIRSSRRQKAAPSPSRPALHGKLQFNLTHSEDLALYAVSSGRRVGIDAEQIRPGFADGTLAESFFAPREVTALRSLPASDQEPAFFACWTRKEAYLKARGEGLVMPLDAFEVSLLPGDPPALLHAPSHPSELRRWSLCELELGPEYAASLAVEGQRWRLCLWQHPGLP